MSTGLMPQNASTRTMKPGVARSPTKLFSSRGCLYPKHLLPETDPVTFTHLINSYFRGRTTLSSSATPGVATGRLTMKDSGNVVADAPIQVKAAPIYGSGRPSVFTSVGNTVPDGTTFVEFGARVNPECTWLQAADFSLVSFALDTGPGGTLSDDFTN